MKIVILRKLYKGLIKEIKLFIKKRRIKADNKI